MKKAIITIGIVAICTLVFLFSFRCISDASSVDSEGTDRTEIEGIDTQSDELADTENNGTPNDENVVDGGALSEGVQNDTTENNASNDSASEVNLRAEEIKNYIKERIIPVIVGVLTSLSAVLASLGAIKKSLSRLSGARDDFRNEASERKSEFARQSALLESKAQELSELAKLLPQLENEISELKKAQDKLNEEAYNIGKMVSLGFSGSYAVVKSGNGRKISALLSKCRALSGRENDENDVEDELLDEMAPAQRTIGEKTEKASEHTTKNARKRGSEAVKNEEN